MGGRQRQNGRREQRSVQEAEREKNACAASRQGNQGLRRLRRIGDIAMARYIQRRRRADDDEEDDYHAAYAAKEDIRARLGILPRTNFFLDEARLEVKELPRRNRCADEP